uniref:Uncharacterized protein n=1 Tax=Glossina palpalis gambiensis TaxID=67801 RepID=A0A1B0B1U9_9MUSC
MTTTSNNKQYRECNKIHLPFSINMMMRDPFGWLLQLLAALETSFVFYSECTLSNLLPWLCIAAIRILFVLGLDGISDCYYISYGSNYQICLSKHFSNDVKRELIVRECFDTNNNSHNNRARSKESQMELRRLYKKPSHRDIIHPHFIINCSQLITTTTNVQ